MAVFNIFLIILGSFGLFMFGRHLYLKNNRFLEAFGMILSISAIVNVLCVLAFTITNNDSMYKAQNKENGVVKYAEANHLVSFYYLETKSGNKIPLIKNADQSEKSKKLKTIFFKNIGRPKGGKSIQLWFSGDPNGYTGSTMVVYYLKKRWLGINIGERIVVKDTSIDSFDLDLLMDGNFKIDLQEGTPEKTK